MVEMSHQSQSQRLFPVELYKFLVSRFNGVAGANVIKVTHGHLIINFHKTPHSKFSTVIQLFDKLTRSLLIIKEKYIETEEFKSNIKLKLDQEEDQVKIKVHGYTLIPPGKFFQLFSLILWYHIMYTTGTRPKNTIIGRKLTERWKIEYKSTLRELNSYPRILRMSFVESPCNKCGKLTKNFNSWIFFYHVENRSIEINTRVCTDHQLVRI